MQMVFTLEVERLVREPRFGVFPDVVWVAGFYVENVPITVHDSALNIVWVLAVGIGASVVLAG